MGGDGVSEEVGMRSGDTSPEGSGFGLDQQNHHEFCTCAAAFAGHLLWARWLLPDTGDSSVS